MYKFFMYYFEDLEDQRGSHIKVLKVCALCTRASDYDVCELCYLVATIKLLYITKKF